MSASEKEGVDGLTGEQLALKGEENISQDKKNINNSLNSISSSTGSSSSKEEEGKKEGVVSLIRTGNSKGGPSKESKGTANTTLQEKENEKTNKNSNKRMGGENHLVAGVKERKGASSPSPSVG